jgi:hypothetical protein
MPVMRKKVWLALVTVAAAGLFLFFGSLWSLPSPEQARELATGTFERYAQQEKFDLRLFEGPTKARDVSGVAYAFEWTYSDAEGKLTVVVLVDRGAWTHLSFHAGDSYDGSQAAIDELDRVIQRVKERSRGSG